MTKINGGKIGINLIFIALFQLITIVLLLRCSLKILKKEWVDIGLKMTNLKQYLIIGLLFGALWAFLQFVFIIPNTGAANRADIDAMLKMYDGSILGTMSFIILGVIGGGITEELFNRGYFITILKDIFENPKIGIWISAILSILTFSFGHMPTNSLEWFDILIPATMYTLLFILTSRLTASIVAHGIYNMSAILLTFYMYY